MHFFVVAQIKKQVQILDSGSQVTQASKDQQRRNGGSALFHGNVGI
jgi:hypothetical protein